MADEKRERKRGSYVLVAPEVRDELELAAHRADVPFRSFVRMLLSEGLSRHRCGCGTVTKEGVVTRPEAVSA